MSTRGPIIVLVGPTASGKTALACALAESLDAEIVSADSQQCYRGLDAGTAKPTADEQARARHHLLDVAWPEEQLDAAAFLRLADAAIADLRARGKRVLVAGGTGLWIRALVCGLLDAPGRSEEFRARFRERHEREGLPALYAELQASDPESAARILPGDRLRIERALEIQAATGQPLSTLRGQHRFAERRYRARVVLLEPARALLWERIERRTRALFAAPESSGEASPIVRETRWLRARALEHPGAAKALGIIGYREAGEALDAQLTPESIAAAIDRTCARTRQYAKRQRSWFRKDAPALDETGAPVGAAPATGQSETEAIAALSSTLRQWYDRAP